MAYLKAREDDKIRKRKEQLHRLAPGYNPPEPSEDSADTSNAKRVSGILEPTKKPSVMDRPLSVASVESQKQPVKPATPPPRDVMDDLVEGLAKMEKTD